MPVATHVLQGDFSALVGEIATIRATIHTNSTDDAWVNDTDDEIRLGGALLALNASGEFSVTLPTSTGTGLQYQVSAEYVNADRQRRTWDSGWFDLTANADLADKANDSTLRINTSLGDQLAARIDGYTDHGDVSGTLAVDPATGTHVLNATGALLVTLGEEINGTIVTLYVVGGADQVTVDGIADLELTDGAFASFVRIRGAWVLASAGASSTPATPDSTPPTAVTNLNATGGSGQVSATWTAATDAESSVSYRWRVWLTSGGATGTWTTTTSTSFTKTGLESGAYTVEVYAYSHGGASATATDTATVTAPLVVDFLDTFTRANGSLSAAPTPNTGGNWAGSTAAPTITSGALVGTGETIYATRGSNPAREASCTVTTTATSDVRFTAWSTADDLTGPRAALLPSGQVSFQGVTNGSVTFNASGGTNYYTPTGYLSYGVHVVKVITNPDGTCHMVIDDITVISAAYDTANAGRHIGITVIGTVDNIEVKA